MRKILSFILGSILALNLTISVANSAANEVRVAYFLEWPSPNLEDMKKKNFAKALGVPVRWILIQEPCLHHVRHFEVCR